MSDLPLLPYAEYAASINCVRTPAGVLLHDGTGRFMLVETTYKPLWDIPGGTTNPNESPWRTAQRELGEEIGVCLSHLRLLVIDHIPAVDGDPMPEGLAFVFDGGLITESDVDSLVLTDPEIRSVGLFTLEQARPLVGKGLWLRIAAAMQALSTNQLVLCDSGQPASSPDPGDPGSKRR